MPKKRFVFCELPKLHCFRAGVSAPHRLAAQAGADILRAGGSALEAAVAVAAALAVVYPHMNSIGGDSFWLVKRRHCKPVAVRACGQAASIASPSFYRSLGFGGVPFRGPLAALTVPGTVRGWQALLALAQTPCRLALRTILEPAVALAREGFEVSPSQERTTLAACAGLRDCSGFAEVFLRSDGSALGAGQCLRQPALARTLQMLADNGLEDFYTGEVAERLCRELTEIGSPLRALDFARCRADIVEPLHLRAFGVDFYNLPAPTQGAASLAILGLMQRAAVRPDSTAAFVHAAVESTKLAFAWRNRHMGDPEHMTKNPQTFLSDASLDALFSRFNPHAASVFAEKQAQGDTVWFGTADSEGMVVSCIQSIYWEFGSGVVLGETGVTMQNRGCAFNFQEGHPNCLRPGALPFHTLNPAMVSDGDGRVIAYGTMGGEGQPQTQAAVILRHLAGMSLQGALDAPRWLVGRTWGEETARLRLESRFDAETVDALRDLGHDVQVLEEAYSDTMGHAGIVSLAADGAVDGASDPRCDGAFIGV